MKAISGLVCKVRCFSGGAYNVWKVGRQRASRCGVCIIHLVCLEDYPRAEPLLVPRPKRFRHTWHKGATQLYGCGVTTVVCGRCVAPVM